MTTGDLILVVYKEGTYELTTYDLTNRYEPKDILQIEKFLPDRPITAVYFEAAQKSYFAKRFKIETTTVDKKFTFIGDTKGSKLIFVSLDAHPRMEVVVEKSKTETQKEIVALDAFVDVRGWKALGNKVSNLKVKEIKQVESLPEITKAAPVSVIEPQSELDDEVVSNESDNEDSSADTTDENGQLGLF